MIEYKTIGANQDAYINALMKADIRLSEIKIEKGVLNYKTARRHIAVIEEMTKRYEMATERVGESGLVPIMRQRNVKWGLITGIVGYVLAVVGMSGYVWRVDVTGNELIETGAITTVLENSGIKATAGKGKINPLSAEMYLLEQFPELDWASIEVKGNTVQVKVSEGEDSPNAVDVTKPCNIIASTDGFITDITVYNGKAVVQKNAVVKKGDVLISGVLDNGELTHAVGDVFIERIETREFFSPFEKEIPLKKGIIAQERFIEFLGMDIPLFLGSAPKENVNFYQDTFRPEFLGVKMPFRYKTNSYEYLTSKKITVLADEVRADLQRQISTYKTNFFRNATELDEVINYDVTESGIKAELIVRYSLNIAKISDI